MFHKQCTRRAARLTASLLLLTQTITGGSVSAYPYYEEQNNTAPTTTTTSGTTPSGGHRGENYIAPIIRLDERVVARKRRASSSSKSSSSSSSASPVCTQQLSNIWTTLGKPGFVNLKDQSYQADQKLAYAPDGTAYVAFKDTSDMLTVMKYDGSQWTTVGSKSFSREAATYVNLAIGPNGTPYVSYATTGPQSRAKALKFDGQDWVQVGASLGSNSVVRTSLAIAPDGAPYLQYQEINQAFQYSASIARFNGTKWVLLPDSMNSSPNYRNITFAPDGTLYLFFSDSTQSSRLSVMKLSGNTWTYVGKQGFSTASAGQISLAFAPDGTPFIAYMNVFPMVVQTFNGTDWVNVGPQNFVPEGRQATGEAIVVDANGKPFVVFGIGKEAHVVTFDGSTWADAAPILPQIDIIPHSLALAPDGSISLLYKNSVGSVLQTLSMNNVCTAARSTSSVRSSSSSSESSSNSSMRSARSSSTSSAASIASSMTSSTPTTLSRDARCVKTDTLNVRGDSRITAAIRWVANKGDRMTVLQIVHDDWAEIQTDDGKRSFVWADNLGPCAQAPSVVSRCASTSALGKITCTTNVGQDFSVTVSPSDR